MKRFTLVALFVCALCTIASARGKQPITFERLPKVVQEEIQKNYQPSELLLITSKKVMPRHYEYTFNTADGTKLVFTNKAVLHNAENIQGVKDAFVPEKVLTYVKETFPNATVTEYRLEYGVHKVELNSAMTLLFTKSGKFLRIDD